MRINSIYQRIKESREFRAYLLWGVSSALLNIGLFSLLTMTGLGYRISNIITLLSIRVFCYMTNKFLVFKSKTNNFVELLREIWSFILSRLVTFFIDYLGVVFLVEVIKIDSTISKIITAVLIIIFNYLLSKFFVFKKRQGE